MDTLSHIVSGAVIGLISTKITNSPEIASISVAIFSSIIPDIDVLSRGLGRRNYLKIHRGITHQFPMAFLIALIAPLIFIGITYDNFMFYYILSLIAIIFHLSLDILNPYGTKILPYYKRFRLNVVGTIDPIMLAILGFNILVLHRGMLRSLWLLPIYLLIRTLIYFKIKFRLQQSKSVKECYLLATYNPFKWNVMLEYPDKFVIADFIFKLYNVEKIKKEYVSLELLKEIYSTKEFEVFAELAYLYNIKQEEIDGITRITLYDLKYRKKKGYHFKLIFNIVDSKIISSYIGFTHKDSLEYVEAKEILVKNNKKRCET